jgi:hypothetical protein
MTITTQDQDFQTTLDLTASLETVFEALTTTSGVSSWWAPATSSASTGGDPAFRFGGHFDSQIVRQSVMLTSPRSADRLSDGGDRVGVTSLVRPSGRDGHSSSIRASPRLAPRLRVTPFQLAPGPHRVLRSRRQAASRAPVTPATVDGSAAGHKRV